MRLLVNKQASGTRKCFFVPILMFLTLATGILSPLYARNNCPDQGPRMSADEYCKLYAAEAQRQMKLYGIPASITLAQGMYESAYGASYIAVVGKNHFGIKAYRGWDGPVVRCDDDRSSEPFCKFGSVMEGYEYHSKFLKNNTRYAPLFKLSSKDYKGWAKGLRECGYATNPKYPQQLIDVIERYNLQRFDDVKTQASAVKQPVVTTGKNKPIASKTTAPITAYTRHKLYSTARKGGLQYVQAAANDNLEAIGREFSLSARRLRRYNDMPKGYVLKEGEVVYVEHKHSKADKHHPEHIVKAGESLHSISQLYGVTVKSIMKRNHLSSASVSPGQRLMLR